jgi:RimJ/RimL family protein N-acetyltransferase
MLIREFDAFRLELLLPWHEAAVTGLEPGDLSAASGEWICVRGREGAFIAEALHRFADGGGFWAGIWRERQLCGLVAIHHVQGASASASLSYALDARFRGRGIMTAACRALIGYGFTEMGLDRVEVIVDAANRPSAAIPERLGFTREGVLRDFWRSADGARDAVRYALSAGIARGTPR